MTKKGAKFSEEHRKNLSDSHKGKYFPNKGQFKKGHFPANKGDWWDYNKASKYVQKFKFKTIEEFLLSVRTGKLSQKIPKHPPDVYAKIWKKKGGWPMFLKGKKLVRLTREETNAIKRQRTKRESFATEKDYLEYRKKINRRGQKWKKSPAGKKWIEDYNRRPEVKKRRNEREAKRREKIRPIINKQEKLRRDNLKLEIFTHYSKKKIQCNFCKTDEIKFLTLDHIRGRKQMGHSRTVAGVKLYTWVRKHNYPKGYQVLCTNCNWLKYVKERKKNLSKNKMAVDNRIYRARVKIEVFSKYCKNQKIKCRCCGFDNLDALSIDHISGRKQMSHTQERAWGGVYLYQWIKRENFPKDFQILCFNCNAAKGYYGKCPHQK